MYIPSFLGVVAACAIPNPTSDKQVAKSCIPKTCKRTLLRSEIKYTNFKLEVNITNNKNPTTDKGTNHETL